MSSEFSFNPKYKLVFYTGHLPNLDDKSRMFIVGAGREGKQRINKEAIKSLTGGDPIPARLPQRSESEA